MALRKRPTPADPDAEIPPEPKAAPPAAAPVEALPPEAPIEGVAKSLLQRVEPIDLPRSAEEMLHNIIVRQLDDDANEVLAPERPDPALTLLAKLQDQKDSGQSLSSIQSDLAKVTQGLDVEDRVTSLAYRSHRNRKLRRWLEADDALDRFLLRLFRRGDFTPSEALVLKRLAVGEIRAMAEELLQAVKDNVSVDPSEVLKMDYTLQMSEREVSKQFMSTTPQGREIIRKITVKARRKLFPPSQPDPIPTPT